MENIAAAMTWLGQQPNTVFIGQGVRCGGLRGSETFAGVPDDRKLEMPVAEQMQLGVSIGLSLEGFVPLSYFPRWNFLLLAADMLVNHLDRLPLYSGYRPRVLIRTAVGASKPLDPGPQHQDDFTEAFRLMLRTVRVMNDYREAYASGGSALLVEMPC